MGDFSKSRSARNRLSRHLKGKDVILRGVSALEYMEYYIADIFDYDVQKIPIYVYSKAEIEDTNIHVKLIDDDTSIEYESGFEIPYATVNQVLTDAFNEPELIDIQILTEAMANYYEENGNFAGLVIQDEHLEAFEKLKAAAMTFYG